MAKVARVRFVTGVSIDVRLQVPGLIEVFITMRAFPVLLVLDKNYQRF